MKVTDELVDVGCDAMLVFYKSGADWTQHPHRAARAVLEAVLADVPGPGLDWQTCEFTNKDALQSALKRAEVKLAKVREWLDNRKQADFGVLEAILDEAPCAPKT